MNVNDSQRAEIAGWVEEGCSIADVQDRLREKFSISMTYMDVRFLVDDLDIEFSEPAEESETTEPAEGLKDSDDETMLEEPELVGGAVTVAVDAVTRPGAMVSGTVSFSDGKNMSWQLGAGGQLGLIPGDDPDYRPLPDDVEEFQIQLQKVLQEKGY